MVVDAKAVESRAALIVCRCRHTQNVPAEVASAVRAGLALAGADALVIDDLCELAARRDSTLRTLAGRPLRIAACFPRAVRWLLNWAGLKPSPDWALLNLRTQTAQEIVGLMLAPPAKPQAVNSDNPQAADDAEMPSEGPPDSSWIPWFPVIDFDRCANCKQCLSFCLFGVYGQAEGGKVHVARPANCKTNCPACARTCPNTAIIFPKYAPGGPIAGDAVGPEGIKADVVNVEYAKLLGPDVMEKLRQRGRGR